MKDVKVTKDRFPITYTRDVFDTSGNNLDTILKTDNASLVSIKYLDLVDLRDSNKLIPGLQYRIIDYICTVNTSEARAVNNPFDIIVVADTTSSINENARACNHEGSTYYEKDDPSKWLLRYTLDNVMWSTPKGHAVFCLGLWFTLKETITIDNKVWYLWYNKDFEGGDEIEDCYFATKELWLRDENRTLYYLTKGKKGICDNDSDLASIVSNSEEGGHGTILWMRDSYNNECPYDFKNIQFLRFKVTTDPTVTLPDNKKYPLNYTGYYVSRALTNYVTYDTEGKWCYTFSSTPLERKRATTDISVTGNCLNNIIGSGDDGGQLLDNVLINSSWNTFGKNCQGNTLNNICNHNIFGDYVNLNALIEDSEYNTFEGNNSFIILGPQNCYNKIEVNCCNIWLGLNCYRNTYKTDCYNIRFLEYCCDNYIDCESNNIYLGASNTYNIFYAQCSGCKTMSNCMCNTFGQSCSNISIASAYLFYSTFASNTDYVKLYSSYTTSYYYPLLNINIHSGILGTYNSILNIPISTRNNSYLINIKRSSETDMNV